MDPIPPVAVAGGFQKTVIRFLLDHLVATEGIGFVRLHGFILPAAIIKLINRHNSPVLNFKFHQIAD